MKQLISRIFNPNKILGSLICLSAAILLIIVFSFRMEDTVAAWFSYLYSVYALIVFIVWFIKVCKFCKNFIKSNSKLYNFYQNHIKEFNGYSLILGLVVNLIYGIAKLSMGIYYKSWWFITLAGYYLLLCTIKVNLIKDFKSKLEKQYRKLKHIGITLLLMNIILAGIIVLIVNLHQTFYYSGYLIYVIALYDFYLITTAFINVFKYRENSEPIISASKCINLTVAMVSMISLETAMIYTFGNNDADFKLLMTLLMGIAVAVINFAMAILLILKSRKRYYTERESK